jgi:hypothetical protein
MKINPRVVTLSLAALLFVAVVHAQTPGTTISPVSTASTITVQISGSAAEQKTGLAEPITFSGPLVVTSVVSTDPALGPGAVVSIDGRGIKGTGGKSGKVYVTECEANLTRPFAGTDAIKMTFPFFEDAPGSYMKAKTGLLTLNLTYNLKTMKLTSVTASVGTL